MIIHFLWGRLYGRAGRLNSQKRRFPARAVPADAETYIHRVGRTGRFGTHGTVRARPGRSSALSVPQRFPMKIHFVWSFCMGAQGA
jgi:hypothetical protein